MKRSRATVKHASALPASSESAAPSQAPAADFQPRGQVIVFSGFRDTVLAAALEAAGAQVVSSATKALTAVVAADPNTTGKVSTARERGLPVYARDTVAAALLAPGEPEPAAPSSAAVSAAAAPPGDASEHKVAAPATAGRRIPAKRRQSDAASEPSSLARRVRPRTATLAPPPVETLRGLLSATPPSTFTRVAVKRWINGLPHNEFEHLRALRDAIELDGATCSRPSLLYLAAAAADMETLKLFRRCDMKPLPDEDVYAALVEAFVESHPAMSRRDVDELHLGIEHIIESGATCPVTASGPSKATVIVVERGWTRLFESVAYVDRWSFVITMSKPQAIAASRTAAQEAASMTAAVAAGDAAVTAQAFAHIKDILWNCQFGDASVARMAAQSAIHVHKRAGTLQALVQHAHDAGCVDLLNTAKSSRNVEILLDLVTAGARARPDDDLYSMVSYNACEASGAPLSDDRVVEVWKRLKEAGVPVPTSDKLSFGLECCVRRGQVQLLRVLVEDIDPFARTRAHRGKTALHFAVKQLQPGCIRLFRQLGFDTSARNDDGATPLGLAMVMLNVPALCRIAVIEALLEGMSDVRELVRTCGVCYPSQIDSTRTGLYYQGRAARMELHIVAAVRATPTGLEHALYRDMFGNVLASILRNEPLDLHSEHGVYIPDQLRAGRDAETAVRLAVHADCRIAAVVDWHSAQNFSQLDLWETFVQPNQIPGSSQTLRAWAFMRRCQALFGRRAVVGAMVLMA